MQIGLSIDMIGHEQCVSPATDEDMIMTDDSVLAELGGLSPDLEELAARVAENTELLPQVFSGLGAKKAKIKYRHLKLLRVVSEKFPQVLYPEFGQLACLLESKNNIFQWGAIIMIGNLASADTEKKIDQILDQFLQPISGPVMITAANTIGAVGKIASAKPYLADRIASALVAVESAAYQTPECRNVALGHVVESLSLFFDNLQKKEPVLAFVQRQLQNSRNAVRRKAAVFLKQYGC